MLSEIRARYRSRTLVVLVTLLLAVAQLPAPPAAAQGGGKPQQVVVAFDREIARLLPADLPATQIEGTITTHVYESLILLDDTGGFQPALAESWALADDKVTWTFKLRQGVKFHDGTAFDAKAVEANWKNLISPDSKYIGANVMRPVFESVKAVDDRTVQFRTKQPFGPALYLIAMDYSGIVSPTALQKHGAEIAQRPVGTGPFKVDEVVPGDRVVLSRYAGYWGPKPRLERIVFRVVPEASTRFSMLENGEAQVVIGVQPQDVPRIKGDQNLTVLSRQGLQGQYMGMNMLVKPFDDVRVRQAINHAINKKALSEALYAGLFTPLDSPITSSTGFHTSVGSYEYNPAKARQLLAEAGFTLNKSDGLLYRGGKPFRTTLWVPDAIYENAKGIQLAQVIQAQLREVGIDVALEKKDSGSWFSILKVAPHEAKYELFMWQYVPNSGDIHQTFDAILRSDRDPPDQRPARFNLTRLRNERVNQLADLGIRETNPKTRARIYREAKEIVWKEAPYAFLFNIAVIAGASKSVSGVRIKPVTYVDLRQAAIN